MSEQLTLSPEFGKFEAICRHWEANHPQYLAHLRELAVRIARSRGQVTIDDVREQMAEFKIPFPAQIGADSRLFGSLLRGCDALVPVTQRPTRREERIARAGVGASFVTVYKLKAVA